MPSKNTTTVVLSAKAQEIKDDLAPVYGLKNILSAGLVLFNKLSEKEQNAVIKESLPLLKPKNSAVDSEGLTASQRGDQALTVISARLNSRKARKGNPAG